jgi:hypothetical protein
LGLRVDPDQRQLELGALSIIREEARMTPIGTPELVLLLVALGGMTTAATWAVIELKKPRK